MTRVRHRRGQNRQCDFWGHYGHVHGHRQVRSNHSNRRQRGLGILLRMSGLWEYRQRPATRPTGLTTTVASSSQINLSWSGSSGATTYNVKRATIAAGSTPPSSLVWQAQLYSDTGLTASTTYYYVVSAVNTNGESANSAEAVAPRSQP